MQRFGKIALGLALLCSLSALTIATVVLYEHREPDDAPIVVRDDQGRERIRLAVTDEGAGLIEFLDTDGNSVLQLEQHQSEAAITFGEYKEGGPAARLKVLENGNSRFDLRDSSRESLFQLALEKGGWSVVARHKTKDAVLFADETRGVGLALRNGEQRAEIELRDDEKVGARTALTLRSRTSPPVDLSLKENLATLDFGGEFVVLSRENAAGIMLGGKMIHQSGESEKQQNPD